MGRRTCLAALGLLVAAAVAGIGLALADGGIAGLASRAVGGAAVQLHLRGDARGGEQNSDGEQWAHGE
jgi:hypothetical protein